MWWLTSLFTTLWFCRLDPAVKVLMTMPAHFSRKELRVGGIEDVYLWLRLGPGRPWQPEEVRAAGRGAPVQPALPALMLLWDPKASKHTASIQKQRDAELQEIFCRTPLMLEAELLTWDVILAVAAAAATAAAAGNPPAVVGDRRGMGGVTAFPTRKYWPPRSNRFIEATASRDDWGLSYSENQTCHPHRGAEIGSDPNPEPRQRCRGWQRQHADKRCSPMKP